MPFLSLGFYVMSGLAFIYAVSFSDNEQAVIALLTAIYFTICGFLCTPEPTIMVHMHEEDNDETES